MRKAVFTIIFVLLFILACSSGREQEIRSIEGVRLFEAVHDDVVYSERIFKGQDAELFSEVVRAECPQGIGDEFVRVALEARSGTLVIYSDLSGKNITCSVLKPAEAATPVLRTQAEAPAEDVAVTVNGEQITVSQLQQALAALPESTPRDENAVNLVLNQLINDELLRQAAAAVEVSDNAVDERVSEIMQQANVTQEQLDENLAQQNITTQSFRDRVRAELQLQALLDQRLLLNEVEITDETARQFYIENPNRFLQSEQAVMRHILISTQSRSPEQAQSRAQQVVSLLNNTDFCELVEQYSDDEQGRENCGVYVIPRGVIDPNLELASFSTPMNQTSIVTTQGGIHLVQTLQVTPAQVVPYTQVAAGLQQDLRNAVLQQRLNLYLQALRVDAEIVSYLG